MGVLTIKQEKLLVLFKAAVQNEKNAQKAYEEMLRFSDDPTITSIIEGLKNEERLHEEKLMKIYRDLRMTAEFGDNVQVLPA